MKISEKIIVQLFTELIEKINFLKLELRDEIKSNKDLDPEVNKLKIQLLGKLVDDINDISFRFTSLDINANKMFNSEKSDLIKSKEKIIKKKSKINFRLFEDLPVQYRKAIKTRSCFFCNSKAIFIVKSGYFEKPVCFKCKQKIKNWSDKEMKDKPESMIDNKRMFSGGLPFTNRRKH